MNNGTVKAVLGFILAIVIFSVIVYSVWFFAGDSGYYQDGAAPDRWYTQRESINHWNFNNGTVWFAMCDHAYLGPLHGTWTIKDGVDLSVEGRYDLRLEGGVIVEARLREAFDS